jgi:hypothetical protein
MYDNDNAWEVVAPFAPFRFSVHGRLEVTDETLIGFLPNPDCK